MAIKILDLFCGIDRVVKGIFPYILNGGGM